MLMSWRVPLERAGGSVGGGKEERRCISCIFIASGVLQEGKRCGDVSFSFFYLTAFFVWEVHF